MSIEASWRLQQGNAFSAFGGQLDAKRLYCDTRAAMSPFSRI